MDAARSEVRFANRESYEIYSSRDIFFNNVRDG